jgi:hypothetical protein
MPWRIVWTYEGKQVTSIHSSREQRDQKAAEMLDIPRPVSDLTVQSWTPEAGWSDDELPDLDAQARTVSLTGRDLLRLRQALDAACGWWDNDPERIGHVQGLGELFGVEVDC